MLAPSPTTTSARASSSSSAATDRRARAGVVCRARAPPFNHPGPLRDQSPTTAPSIIADRAATACCALLLSVAAATTTTPPPAAAAPPLATTEAAATTTTVQLAVDALADAFERRQYYVTGDLPEGLFDDQCVFIDPTTRVVGAKKYANVVAKLFDGAHSRADLLCIAPGVEPSTVELKWRLEGQLALPGNPPIKAYTGSTLYRLDPAGKVREQVESWDVSAFDAFASSFLPKALWTGAPPAPPAKVLREQMMR